MRIILKALDDDLMRIILKTLDYDRTLWGLF